MEYTEYQKRLYGNAEQFYYAGILSSMPFNGKAIDIGNYRSVFDAEKDIFTHISKPDSISGPPLVNFAFAIELYIKLAYNMATKQSLKGHNIFFLFQRLDQLSPEFTKTVIDQHIYARGDRSEFIELLQPTEKIFEEWRYAHEKEFLCESPDTLLVIANAFRAAFRELHADFCKNYEE